MRKIDDVPGVDEPTIVAVIGSSRFKQAHLGVHQRETLLGKIVLGYGFYHHVDMVPLTDKDKSRLDELNAHKVRIADEVIVVNIHGYIGEATRRLIRVAESLDKPVRYLEENR